jgi:hypothetical protein
MSKMTDAKNNTSAITKANTSATNLAKPLRNQKGLAMVETVPLIVVFVALLSFTLGLFGVIHTATLNSIGARTYAFETFRQRTDLSIFRENGSGLNAGRALTYETKGWRFHAVNHESDDRNRFVPTTRLVAFGRELPEGANDISVHNQQIYELPRRNERIAVNPVWIMVGYGICLNAQCGN